MWADCWRVSGEVCTAEVSVGFTDIRTTSSEYKTGSTHVIWSVTMGGSKSRTVFNFLISDLCTSP